MTSATAPPAGSWRTAALALLLVALVAAAFSPAFGARFVNWDDNVNLEDLREHRGDPLHFFHTTGQVDPYQPLAWCSWMLDANVYGLDAGLDAPQAGRFHATSVALHALAAVALFLFARRLFALAMPSGDSRRMELAAALAAFVFAVHPLRAESVAWFTERRDVLSGAFLALAAWAWMVALPSEQPRVASTRAAWTSAASLAASVALFFASVSIDGERPLQWGALGPVGLSLAGIAWIAGTIACARGTGRTSRAARWFVLAATCAVLALFSKALAVVLPVWLLVLDVGPLRRLRRESWAAIALEKLPLVSPAIVVAALASWAQARAGQTLVSWEGHTLGERVAQAFYGLGFYASRTVAPLQLVPVVPLPDDVRWSELRFLVSALSVVAAAIACLALRRRVPALLAAAAAYFVALLPVLGLTQAGMQLVADRYSYLACVPLALLAASAWLAARSSAARMGANVLAFAACAALGIATWTQTRVWRDSDSLWGHTLALDPDNVMALGQLAALRGQQSGAAADPAERQRLRAEAEQLYRRALALDPTPLPRLPFSYGLHLLALGRAAEAEPLLRRYVEQFPRQAPARAHLGAALAGCGRLDEALAELQRAVELDPDYPHAWRFLGGARALRGDKPGAIAAYEQVLRIWPGHEPTLERLATLRGP
jgi:tetratricopeptide (TPR) repeat protein